MKAGFWVAPEGEDAAMTLLPIGGPEEDTRRRINLLATRSGEEMIARCPATAALLPRIVAALETLEAGQPGVPFDITEFGAEDKELLAQVLGEGEVAGVAALPNGLIAQIQESVMAGLWRVRFLDGEDRLVADYIEAASVPAVVGEACAATAPALVLPPAPQGAMNVMPVLAEIGERMALCTPGTPAHTITFSLFPMNETDMSVLQETLGAGPVSLTSRGYGTCRVVATAARHVWSVQFYNAMDTVILDTLEIVDVPEAVKAATEDFRESAIRLHEIQEAYFA